MIVDHVINIMNKIIETNRDLYLINGTYFNPVSAVTLDKKVDELEDLGISLSATETESDRGRLVSASISSKNGSSKNLGTVLLDGSTIITKKELVPYTELETFIRQNSVQFNES